MKKTIAILLTTVFLASCGSTPEAEQNSSWLQVIDKTEFSISLPEKWSEITDSSKLPTPKIWEVSLAATSSDLKYWFANNVLVLSQDISKPVTSNDFSLLNNVWSSKEYLEYLKLETKKIEFADKDSSTAYIFEAKYNAQTPKLKFIQYGKVCWQKRAHLITIAVGQDTKDMDPYVEFAKTFACK